MAMQPGGLSGRGPASYVDIEVTNKNFGHFRPLFIQEDMKGGSENDMQQWAAEQSQTHGHCVEE